MAIRDRTIENLIERLNRLPGIGPKTAERLAFHLLRVDQQEALELAAAIEEVRKAVKNWAVCFQLSLSMRTLCAMLTLSLKSSWWSFLLA